MICLTVVCHNPPLMAENMSLSKVFLQANLAMKGVRQSWLEWVEKGEDAKKWLLGRSSLSLICDLWVLVKVNE
jgi:hypothetical protein